MKCPKCNKEQYCIGGIIQIIEQIRADNVMSCGHCGYTMHADGWLDEQWRQFKEDENGK